MDKNIKITTIAAIGMFLSMFDTGIVAIAVSHITQSLHGINSSGPLILTSYSLMLCGTILFFGDLSSKYGSIIVFKSGMLLLLVSSVLCAFSPSMWILILFRGIQGISAAMIQSTAITLTSQYVTEKNKTKSIATVITFASIGPILAPTVGGFILNYFSWEWLFYINIPFCLVSLFLSLKIEKVNNNIVRHHQFQLLIYSSFVISLISGIIFSMGWLLTASLGLAILIIYSEIKSKHQGVLFNKHILNFKFYLSILGSLFLGSSTSCMFIIPPIKLLASDNILFVSFIVMTLPVFTVFISKISPGFIAKYGYQKICIIGFVFMFAGTLGLLKEQFSTAYTFICLASFGIGCGLFQPSNTLMLFQSSDKSYHAMSNSLSRLFVNLGIALGSSLVAVFYL
ncbi:MFS transporter [Vibrio aerogenes]|nr:MFS transporter [Vibrio aerogenes]